jgi:hydroxyacylglutathione hydrolase
VTKQLKSYQVPIIGGKDCAKVSKTPTHNEEFTVGEGIKVKALHTPCHTQDSICYLFEDGDDRAVFTGDTLFIGGMYLSTKTQLHRVEAGEGSAAD